jgi:CRISPR-associated RAMP protein (TIGR02581 family)
VHSTLINQAFIEMVLVVDGPILVKAGDTGADPTRPDMEFVRTYRSGTLTVYLPGSSLKGALRAHCEKILRSLAPDAERRRYACDPTSRDNSCGRNAGYAGSCHACRLFGNTGLRGRVSFHDAYPEGAVRLEERNGVAIDRVYGSVSGGKLYNFEVMTQGRLKTALHVSNFTIGQLGLLAFALRDLRDGRLALGFGKSRGLGRVGVELTGLTVRYPTAQIEGQHLVLAGQRVGEVTHLVGIGAFSAAHGLPTPGAADRAALPAGVELTANKDWGEPELKLEGEEGWPVLAACARNLRPSLEVAR